MYGNKRKVEILVLISLVIMILINCGINVYGATLPTNMYIDDIGIQPIYTRYVTITQGVEISFIILVITNFILYFIEVFHKKLTTCKMIFYPIVFILNIVWIIKLASIIDEAIASTYTNAIDSVTGNIGLLLINLIILIIQLIILIQLVINIKKSKKEENPKCQE